MWVYSALSKQEAILLSRDVTTKKHNYTKYENK